MVYHRKHLHFILKYFESRMHENLQILSVNKVGLIISSDFFLGNSH